MPKTDEPKAFGGEAGVAPPKIEAVLVLVLALAPTPPNIFAAGFATAADPNIFPDADGLAVDEAGVDDRPKPPNDTDALSIDFEPKIFPPVAG